MHEYRYQQDDYIITVYYEGKKLTFRIKRYHTDRKYSHWWLFTKSQVQGLRWDQGAGLLEQELQYGQTPFPGEFLEVIAREFREIHKK